MTCPLRPIELRGSDPVQYTPSTQIEQSFMRAANLADATGEIIHPSQQYPSFRNC